MNIGFLVFLMLPLLGLAYVCWHIWVLLPLSAIWKSGIVIFTVVCFLLLFPVMSGMLEKLPLTLSRILYAIGTSSIIVLLYVVMMFFVLDVGRLLNIIPRSWLYANWITAAAMLGTVFTIMLCGNIHYNSKVRVPLELNSAKPLSKDYTIVMASDLHLGFHNTRSDLVRWIDLINAEQPDLVLIAGDIIDISIKPLIDEDMSAEFRRLKVPVYACLGNHEYYSGEPRAQQFFADAGIHLLKDSCALVDDLCLIGRDDRTNRSRTSIMKLMQQADKTKYIILLDHQPYHLEQAERAGIDLQLSGHTHEGQVWPVSWITHSLYECSWGKHKRGNTNYYVSSGLGIWGGKFRIGTQSEYVVIKLRR
ncbi:MAG: metallophosphoesterase [Bacteroidaceae bacterium]|nr:metallophosphoesterase [Bacteroidaceae bacterium]